MAREGIEPDVAHGPTHTARHASRVARSTGAVARNTFAPGRQRQHPARSPRSDQEAATYATSVPASTRRRTSATAISTRCDGATAMQALDDHGQQLRRSDPVLQLPCRKRQRHHISVRGLTPMAHRHPTDPDAPRSVSGNQSASRTTEGDAALPCANARPTAGAARGVHSGTVTLS